MPIVVDVITLILPTPEDQKDEDALRFAVLASDIEHRVGAAPAPRQSLLPPKPTFQPTFRHPHSNSPSCQQLPATGVTPPSVLKDKKTVTFLNLTGERRYSDDEEPAPNSSYPSQRWAFCTKYSYKNETTTLYVQCNMAAPRGLRNDHSSKERVEDLQDKKRSASRSLQRERSRSRFRRQRPFMSPRSTSRRSVIC